MNQSYNTKTAQVILECIVDHAITHANVPGATGVKQGGYDTVVQGPTSTPTIGYSDSDPLLNIAKKIIMGQGAASGTELGLMSAVALSMLAHKYAPSIAFPASVVGGLALPTLGGYLGSQAGRAVARMPA